MRYFLKDGEQVIASDFGAGACNGNVKRKMPVSDVFE
jgi:hypothetical protein